MARQPFDGDGRLRVAALFSGGASAACYLADHDPDFGEAYEVVGAYASDPEAPGVAALEDRGIPVAADDVEAFYEARGADTGDMDVREAYDRRTADRLAEWNPDVVMLSGYMWILTDPVVDEFPVLNVHPGDLAVTDADGERRYVGYDPVHDAVTDGATETRSTVHLVTPEVDEGPILVRSSAFPVHRDLVGTLQEHGAEDALRDYVDAHQEWMKWDGDGPAFAAALELIADGRVERDGGIVRIDGEPAPEGYVLDE